MSQWRRETIQRFPELHRQIANAEGLYFVWLALRHALFKPAYEKEPPDTEAIARVYEYAAWSREHRSLRVRKAVEDGFYESLADDPQTWGDMPRWVSQEEFDTLHLAWDYMTPQSYTALRREFIANKARIDIEDRNRRPKSASGGRSKE